MPTTGQLTGRPWHAVKIPAPPLQRYLAAAVLTADGIDYWIRRYVIEYWLRHHTTDFSPDELWSAEPQTIGSSSPSSARVSAPEVVSRRTRINRPLQSGLLPLDSRVWLSAIGQRLKAEYDAIVGPVPPRLAALVKQLEMQE